MGRIQASPPAQQAIETVLALTPRAPRRALALARRALAGAGASRDPVDRGRLERALGHALRAVGRHREARQAYLRARRVLARAGEPYERAICAIGLVDACMYLGRSREALAVGRAARAVFTRRRDQGRLGRLELNLGNLHHRAEALRPALAHYERAAQLLARHGTASELARVNHNQANILASLGRIEEARLLFIASRDALEQAGEHVLAAQVRYGLACLSFLAGHYAAAMSELESVRPELDRLGARSLLALADLDLSEVLIALRLDPEALSLARSAERWFASRGLPAEVARARLVRGLALSRLGRPNEAKRALDGARRRFRLEGNRAGLAAVALVRSRRALAAGRPGEAARLADEARRTFAGAGFASRALLAGTLAAEARLEARAPRAAGVLARRLLAEPRTPGDGFARARLLRLLGRTDAADNRLKDALRHYRAALDEARRTQESLLVDEWRFEYGGDEPPVLDEALDLLLRRSPHPRPDEIWSWIARARGSGPSLAGSTRLPSAPVRALLARLRSELEACYARLWPAAAGPTRRFTGIHRRELEQRAQSIEGRLRRLAGFNPSARSRPQGARAVAATGLGAGETRITYFVAGRLIHALVTSASGTSEVRRLGPASDVDRHVALLQYQMDLGIGGASPLRSHSAAVRRRAGGHLAALGDQLVAPLLERASSIRRWRVVPARNLARIPFAALRVEGRPLVDLVEIAVEPWPGLELPAPRTSDMACVLGFGDLVAPGIEEEARRITGLLEDAGLAVRAGWGTEARRDVLERNAGSCALIHLAGHGLYRRRHPEFSAIRLADGWLTAADLAGWPMAGATVVLSACETGPRATAGSEVLGLARGFLRAGASAVVASLWRVDDRATLEFMSHLYAGWRKSNRLGEALAMTQRSAAARGEDPCHWGPFVLFGRPDVSWPGPSEGSTRPVGNGIIERASPAPNTPVRVGATPGSRGRS